MLKLFGANVSPFVRKVKVVLAEKNLPFEQQQTAPFPPTAEYRKISPLGRIPAFQDGDQMQVVREVAADFGGQLRDALLDLVARE